MTKEPLISVIVPAHNVEDYLYECVESVLQGTYSNFEMILIENGSEDGTASLCDRIVAQDSRVRVVHTAALGVATARNTGLEMSKGDYVCFIDADDLVSQDYLEYLVNITMEADAEIGVASTVKTFFNQNELPTPPYVRSSALPDKSSDHAIIKMLCYQMKESCFSKIFDRHFLIQNDVKFYDDLYVGEGFNFNILAFSKAKTVVMSEEQIYYYRISNPNSAMTKVDSRKLQNGLKAVRRLKHTLRAKTDNIQNALAYAEWHTNFDFLMTLLAGGHKSTSQSHELYLKLKKASRRGCLVQRKVKISTKDRFKAISATIFPVFSGEVFNRLRKRKFTL